MKKILLVDHDLTHRAAFAVALRAGIGWKFIPETDVQSAVGTLENSKIDVLILSDETPGVDPLSFICVVHALKPNLPVIVLSRHSSADMHQKIMSHGAFEHLAGPVTVIELGRVVRSALLKAEQDSCQ